MSAFGGKADIGSSGFVQQRRIVAHQKCIVGYQERVQLSPALAPGVICSRSLRAERKRLYLVPVRLAEILATEAA